MGVIYLINAERTDYYKIGITKGNANKRLKALQTGSVTKLVLVDFYKSDLHFNIETILHRLWKHKKFIVEDFEDLKGEWFKLEFNDVKEFGERCRRIEWNLNFLKESSSIANEFIFYRKIGNKF